MRLVLAEPRFLKDPISVISELVNEVKNELTYDAIAFYEEFQPKPLDDDDADPKKSHFFGLVHQDQQSTTQAWA